MNSITRRLIAMIITIMLIASIPISAFAENTENDEKEVTREEVVQEHGVISQREATISMLLDAGWTMDEINEWYTEEDLLELDQNALAVSNSAMYTVNYEDAESDEVTSIELSRQEFDYGVNQVQCKKEDMTIQT